MDLAHCRQLADAVRHLATHDGDFEQFGARTHGYVYATPLTVERLHEIERAHGVSLPGDYAAFVTTVGSAGAGPYYGLLPLDAPTQLASLARDFPHTSAVPSPQDEASLAAFDSDATVDGTIALAHAGCTYFALLVVRGPARGQVWFDFRSAGGGLDPTYDSFGDFYRDWLEKLTRGEVVELRNDPKTCALPKALSSWIGSWEKRNDIPAGTATPEQVDAALRDIRDGGLALRAASTDRYFLGGTPVDPCPSCKKLLQTLLATHSLRPGQLVPGVRPRAASEAFEGTA